MADDQRPAEAANRADSEARHAHDIAEMTADRSPHDRAVDALSVAAPAGGYAREGS
ncbi:MAG: hypothetical protein ACTHPS_30840 [Streptosporangiaceae bacterium]